MLKTIATYVLALAAFVVALVWVSQAGRGLGTPLPTASSPADLVANIVAAIHTPLCQLLLQILIIVLVARAVGSLFTRFGQPTVVGEMFAGVALGPSLLGLVSPATSNFLFPANSLVNLGLISQVGIILFMFVVGMEVDTKMLRKVAHSALLVSHVSIVVPFSLGMASALFLFSGYAGPNASFTPFALFMGISMSITAFPVLARIIQDRHLGGTPLANLAITCAAVDDVTAWCGLAFIVAIAKAESLTGSGLAILLLVFFVAGVVWIMTPALERALAKASSPHSPGPPILLAVVICLFFCSFFTEAVGIHALFGAFVCGLAMPKSREFRRFLRHRLEYFSSLFLLPVFFAFTGLRTHVAFLDSGGDWLVCGYLLLIAVFGKLGGSALAGRITGLSWRESVAVGALLNTRGLMELIALNLGLDLGVLSQKSFAMLILMALLTTLLAGPLVGSLGFGKTVSEAVGEPALA